MVSEPSMIEDGKFSVLFADIPHFDEANNIVESKKVIQYLNGAMVANSNTELKYAITKWKKFGEAIDEISFTMPSDEDKLSEVFSSTPYGLIKKNKTGIGATTLELRSPRNSIIVVPTKALAYEKAKGGIDKVSGRHTILYKGSTIAKFTPPSVKEYLTYEDVIYKKILVVADSLPKLLEEIGENAYKDFFLMVDEIDSYQYDISFRPNIEKVIDCYFLFPKTKRCLVSATIGDFSNPHIAEEPVINVTFHKPQVRSIYLTHTNNTILSTANKIKEIRMGQPEDFILVAFNSIDGILKIVSLLGQKDADNICILCSPDSKADVGDLYSEINDGNLTKRITFMTCSFFVGIDILQQFHLISVSDVGIPHSLLSVDKLQQIAGRCRHQEGLLTEDVIYSTKTLDFHPNGKALKAQMINDAEAFCNYARGAHYIQQNNLQEVLPPQNAEFVLSDFIKGCTPRYVANQKSASVIRQAADGSLRVSYFAIDNYLILISLRMSLYVSAENLVEALRTDGHNIMARREEIEPTTEENEVVENNVSQRNYNAKEQWETIINQLAQIEDIDKREKQIQTWLNSKELLHINRTNLKRLKMLYRYVDLKILANKLLFIGTTTAFNVFYDKTIIWALPNDHVLKIAIKEKFPINMIIPVPSIKDKMNAIWHGLLGLPYLSQAQATRRLDYFMEKSARTSMGNGRDNVNGYKILNYDPNGFGVNPQTNLPASTDVRDKLKSIK